jgi:hypothetical protein
VPPISGNSFVVPERQEERIRLVREFKPFFENLLEPLEHDLKLLFNRFL